MTADNTIECLNSCNELFEARNSLIHIFTLINERSVFFSILQQKLLEGDLTKLINKNNIEKSQMKYLNSLINTLTLITGKIIEKITRFRQRCPLFNQNFLISNHVSNYTSQDYIYVCKMELKEIHDLMVSKCKYQK